MRLHILSHPVFVNLNFHMPMVLDLSHPVVMLSGENGSGKSTLLHSIYYALKGQQIDGYVYRLDPAGVTVDSVFLFDAEQHNPRTQLEFFKEDPEMLEFLRMASHGQVMLSMFQQNFPSFRTALCCCWTSPKWRCRYRTSAGSSRCCSNSLIGAGSASSPPPTP